MKSWITLLVPNEYVYMDLRKILIDNVPLTIDYELYGAFEDAIKFGLVAAGYNTRTTQYVLQATPRGRECWMIHHPPQIWIPID